MVDKGFHRKGGDLYCLGSSLVDYEFNVEVKHLQHLGIAKGQMTLAEDEVFDRSLDYLAQELNHRKEGGGSAINSLITYARLGGKGSLPCIVGDDESGEFFLKELRDLGIILHPIASSLEQATGRCLALITPDKDRTMMTNLGINKQLRLTEGWEGNMRSAKVFYAESYLLAIEDSCSYLIGHLEEARLQDMFIALSMSDVSMVEHYFQRMEEALSGRIDILFGNYSEYSHYSGEKDEDRIFASFPEHIRCMVLTQGGNGALIYLRGDSATGSRPRKFKVPAVKTNVMDTLGAGDTYAGAFLYCLCERNASCEEAAKFSAHAASLVVSRMGPRLNQKECDELNALFG